MCPPTPIPPSRVSPSGPTHHPDFSDRARIFWSRRPSRLKGLSSCDRQAKYSIPAGDKVDVIVEFSGKVKSVSEVKPVDDK
jgi:hypothetical protein